jgi:hypothetical protein
VEGYHQNEPQVEGEGVDWIDLAQNRNWWQVLVEKVMNF